MGYTFISWSGATAGSIVALIIRSTRPQKRQHRDPSCVIPRIDCATKGVAPHATRVTRASATAPPERPSRRSQNTLTDYRCLRRRLDSVNRRAHVRAECRTSSKTRSTCPG